MKKSIKLMVALSTLFATPVLLTSCGNESSVSQNTVDQERTDAAIAALSVPSSVTENFTLTTTGLGNTTISWVSDNAAIAIEGATAKVTRPEDADVTVKLTATATYNAASSVKDFNVTVEKQEDLGEYVTVRSAIEAENGASLTVRGVVSGFSYKDDSNGNGQFIQGLYLTDATGTIYAYGPQKAQSVSIGDEVIVEAPKSDYTNSSSKTAHQLGSMTSIRVLNSDVDVPLDSVIEGKTLKDIMDEGDTTIDHTYKVKVKVVAYQGNGYVNYEVMDSAGTWILLQGSSSGAEFVSLVSDELKDMALSVVGFTNKGALKMTITHIY